MTKLFKILLSLTLLCVFALVALLVIKPTDIIWNVLHIGFHNPPRVNSIIYKDVIFLIIVSTVFTIIQWIVDSKYREGLVSLIYLSFEKASYIFTIRFLFIVSLVYLVVLYFIAITHYDLGFDEAWYIVWARSFAATGSPFNNHEGKLMIVDNISMLPYYLLAAINFKAGLTDIVYFKILSSVLTVISLVIFFRVAARFYNKSVAVVSIFILITQPGFGFVASSFFGELLAMGFIFLGVWMWLKDSPPHSNKSVFITALLLAIAINTKFQVIIILSLSLLILHFTDKNSKALKILVYTLVFSASMIIIRSLPTIIQEPKHIMNLLVFGYLEDTTPHAWPIFDKIQLYNRFFPFSVLLLSLSVFYFYMKTEFDRFMFLFAAITSIWWTFLYPYSTYRTPYMGLIPLALIISILLVKFYNSASTRNSTSVKVAATVVVLIFMLYGFSANIIYAYIGYNDGVQFDLDGNRNRLFSNFSNIVYDDSQKEFYSEIGKMLRPLDTLYNGSFVTSCYLNNPVASVSELKESVKRNLPGPKYLLITREFFPLGVEKGRQILDSLNANWKLEYKKGDFELYSVFKK